DAFAPLNWPHRFSVFREDYSTLQSQFANVPMGFQRAFGNWAAPYTSVEITYRSFPADLTVNLWGYRFYTRYGFAAMRGLAANRPQAGAPMEMNAATALADRASVPPLAAPAGVGGMVAGELYKDALGTLSAARAPGQGGGGAGGEPATRKPDLSQVAARKNLNETAF